MAAESSELATDGGPDGRGELENEIRRRWGWLPYRILGSIALFGCGFVLVCDVVMWFLVEGYNPIGQTISELAAGPHAEIQDTGIVVFALGIATLTAGMILRGWGGRLSWAVRIAFVLLGLDVVMIALWNEYGDAEAGGLVIHGYLVAMLYVLTAFVLWFGTSVPPARGDQTARFGKIAAAVWVPTAPLFYVVPDTVDGLYERGLALVMVGAVALAAVQLYKEPKDE